jgi:hypothetical protein
LGVAGAIDLGTYRTSDGDLVHCWYDASGVLMAERDGDGGKPVRVDPRTVTGAVKLSDDPHWPDSEPAQQVLWQE